MKKNKYDGDMAHLSRAITRALLNSEEVINILNELKESDKLKSDSMMAFILKANDLLAISRNDEEPHKKNKILPKPPGLLKPATAPENAAYIDGEKLTKKEIEFAEYCAERFDEMEWLREIKIKSY